MLISNATAGIVDSRESLGRRAPAQGYRSAAANVPAGRRRACLRSSRRFNCSSGRTYVGTLLATDLTGGARSSSARRRGRVGGGLSLPRHRDRGRGDARRPRASTGRGHRLGALRAARDAVTSCTAIRDAARSTTRGFRRASLPRCGAGSTRPASCSCSPGSSDPSRHTHSAVRHRRAVADPRLLCDRSLLEGDAPEFELQDLGDRTLPGGTGPSACSDCRPEARWARLARVERWATFDCYGTLIDWNGGIRRELARHLRRGARRTGSCTGITRWSLSSSATESSLTARS